MSAPLPLERALLVRADEVLTHGSQSRASDGNYARRLDILDAAAALIGGFDLASYRKKCLAAEFQLPEAEAIALAEPVVAEIKRAPIPSALALSALAREPLSKQEIRTAGAHYTDFRLALLIVSCPLLSGPSTMTVWIKEGTTHACQEAQA
ncbi:MULTISPECIES: hypothetical protein [Sphingomonas]|uniref:hypothetical protein n=1 Tax=Sphingomonas TaxID=13687 RepID=UPI000DBBEE53|nr:MULTISPECIES: hypothetical protein [Sphingomonas]PZT95083.1 MAG: hypothetical protein DI625_06095 [Sphingomonas sp.]WCP73378.1 hypothetical protein PPZ50_07500 [Sphingomonas hankookensis]